MVYRKLYRKDSALHDEHLTDKIINLLKIARRAHHLSYTYTVPSKNHQPGNSIMSQSSYKLL